MGTVLSRTLLGVAVSLTMVGNVAAAGAGIADDAAVAARASSHTTIQPGVPIRTGSSGCTLNWIYVRLIPDPDTGQPVQEGTYAGTAAHCVDEVDQDVHLLDQQLGDAVLRIGHVAFIAPELDYAFIRVDDENLELVDPSLKGHPDIPTGVSTTQTSAAGDHMQFSGQGAGFHLHPATQEERVGVLCHNDGEQHYIYGPVISGDSGGPVANLTDDNKAFGIVTTLGGSISTGYTCAGEGGVSLEGMFADADDHGWDMRLKTLTPSGDRPAR